MDGRSAIRGKKPAVQDLKKTEGSAYKGETYYGLPPVKHSIYKWTIGISYFAIGLAGASQVLSTVLDLKRQGESRSQVRAGRYLALAGSLLAPALYIKELGTPRKWYNMLRIFRPTSVMSTSGVWALTDFGVSCGFTALGQLLQDLGQEKAGKTIARFSSISGLPLGALMSVYMGTELEETSTPLWAKASPLLAPLFGLNNASNALAVFEIAERADNVPRAIMRGITILSMGTEIAEIVLLKRIESRWTAAANSSSLYESRYNLPYRTGLITLGKLIGLSLRGAAFLGGSRSARFRRMASIATLSTGFFLPNIILLAGNKSADRPQDYFSYASSSREPVPANVEESSLTSGKREAEKKGLKWLGLGLALGAAASAFAYRKKKVSST